MSLEKVCKIVDDVLGTSYANGVVEEETKETRSFVIGILMDYLYNDKAPEYVYMVLKDKNISGVTVLEIAALIGEMDELKVGQTDDKTSRPS
jgi:hypothetical protein